MITTQKELRAAFWEYHPEFKKTVKKVGQQGGRALYVEKTQNDYPADVRMAWCDFIDHMAREGQINRGLAQRATL